MVLLRWTYDGCIYEQAFNTVSGASGVIDVLKKMNLKYEIVEKGGKQDK